MRPLIIGADELFKISVALAMARKNPVSREWLERFQMGTNATNLKLADRPKDLDRLPSQHVALPYGYHAAISFEDQPAGLVRHLSISVDTPGKMPNMHAIAMILDAFGLKSGKALHFWTEEFDPGHHAFNIVQLDEDCS
jgi:hypothetical protein